MAVTSFLKISTILTTRNEGKVLIMDCNSLCMFSLNINHKKYTIIAYNIHYILILTNPTREVVRSTQTLH